MVAAYTRTAKCVILFLLIWSAAGCTSLYRGDGEYIVEGQYFFTNYSIVFPEVPLDRNGVYVYQFDNYYTANSSRELKFETAGRAIIPTIMSTNVKFEVFDARDELIAFMDSPLNRRELAFYQKPLVYPKMSWFEMCSSSFNENDHESRKMIARDPGNKKLLEDHVRRFKITACTFSPDHSPESPYQGDWDGGRIKSFHKYKIILTVSDANPALKDTTGRLVLRSGWK